MLPARARSLAEKETRAWETDCARELQRVQKNEFATRLQIKNSPNPPPVGEKKRVHCSLLHKEVELKSLLRFSARWPLSCAERILFLQTDTSPLTVSKLHFTSLWGARALVVLFCMKKTRAIQKKRYSHQIENIYWNCEPRSHSQHPSRSAGLLNGGGLMKDKRGLFALLFWLGLFSQRILGSLSRVLHWPLTSCSTWWRHLTFWQENNRRICRFENATSQGSLERRLFRPCHRMLGDRHREEKWLKM